MNRLVLFVGETAQLGGAELNLLPVARRLPRRGWQPAVVLPGPGPFTGRLQAAQIPVHYVPRPPFISTTYETRSGRRIANPLAFLWSLLAGLVWAWRLFRFIRRRRPAVVHTISMWSHAFAGLAARLAARPVVWHFQDIVSPNAGWGLYRRLVLWAARFIPGHIVCIADRVAAPFRTDPRLAAKTAVLWNAIEVERFVANGSSTHAPAGDGPLRIGTIGRLTPWKGQEAALEVARLLKQRAVPFRWRFVGDEALGSAGYARRLRDLVEQWHLANEVEFLGWIDDTPAFYQDLDALVHMPAAPEPFGLVLAEAMAAGLPIVATCGGGAEPLVAAAGGALVAVGDTALAADVLAGWWQAPGARQAVAKQARALAHRTFTLDPYLDRLVEIYLSIIPDPDDL